MIWIEQTAIDGSKKVSIPVENIDYFSEVNRSYTKTIIHLKSGQYIESTENMVILLDRFELRKHEEAKERVK